jgi:NAD(P)-dependent dehydrogenase (short-subunit alcohol dehydrogenase family)
VLAFAKAGWNVVATMRNPDKETELNKVPNVKLYQLDVRDSAQVMSTMAQIKQDYKHIDVLVNNAGFAVDGIFEGMSDAVIENQFQTNVFGLMRLTREAIKIMREQNAGTIVQIASMGGRLAFPGYSIYHSTKWAVEGFSDSLQYELAPFNIKVKVIEPGAIKTDFYTSSREFVKPDYTKAYDEFCKKVEKVSMEAGHKGEDPALVAQCVVKAAEDTSNRLRYAVGSPAPLLLWLRKRLPDSWFSALVRSSYKI